MFQPVRPNYSLMSWQTNGETAAASRRAPAQEAVRLLEGTKMHLSYRLQRRTARFVSVPVICAPSESPLETSCPFTSIMQGLDTRLCCRGGGGGLPRVSPTVRLDGHILSIWRQHLRANLAASCERPLCSEVLIFPPPFHWKEEGGGRHCDWGHQHCNGPECRQRA